MRSRDLAEAEFRPLGLDSRAINALWARDICTLRDLSKLTEWDISVIPGIGTKTKGQLRIYLRSTDAPAQEIHTRSRIVATRFEPDMLTEIDSWILEQGGHLARAEAVRRLVALALKAKK